MTERKRQTALLALEKANAANRVRLASYQHSTFTCPQCGTERRCKPRDVRLKKRVYCSRVCMAEAYRVRLNGAANPNYRNLAPLVCVGCGVEFQDYQKDRKYCTHECYQSTIEAELRRGNRLDANHREIIEALTAAGASVLDTSMLGQGKPDAIIAYNGVIHLVEIKNPKTSYGKQGLSKVQKRWADQWTGSKIHVVTSVEEAFEAIGIGRYTTPTSTCVCGHQHENRVYDECPVKCCGCEKFRARLQ